ncbi:MAG: glycosyltransferase family 2 protein [Moorellaceae bacterium]
MVKRTAAKLFPKVSVIVPCRNERNYICRCIESIFNNSYEGEIEVIVVDGMSDDGTRELLRELQTRYKNLLLLDNPSRITPAALNIGLRVASGDVILRLDAHCEMGANYISTVSRRLFSSNEVGCAGGRTTAHAREEVIERAISTVLTSPFGIGNSYFRLVTSGVREVDTVAYGAYRREVFEKVGVFDERLIRNQDIEFNYRIRKAGYKILLDPSVEVYYYPRRSLAAFCKQNFGNGFWNIITWKLVPGSLSWRHFVPLVFVMSLVILGVTSLGVSLSRLLLSLEVGTYMFINTLETVRIAVTHRKPSLLFTFLVFPALHLSYGIGSIWGVLSVLSRTRRIKSSNRRS